MIRGGTYTMKWLEVIKLRSAGKDSRLLEELLLSIDEFNQNGLIEIKTFRHATVESDWSIHLHWESKRLEQNGSSLGLRLAQAFKEFGLVDHSVWIEEEK
jgi:hypothetical protein